MTSNSNVEYLIGKGRDVIRCEIPPSYAIIVKVAQQKVGSEMKVRLFGKECKYLVGEEDAIYYSCEVPDALPALSEIKDEDVKIELHKDDEEVCIPIDIFEKVNAIYDILRTMDTEDKFSFLFE
ncbi:MAG: hypothetical protein QXU54_02040 [Candidatus Micrarchaeia archaeon]